MSEPDLKFTIIAVQPQERAATPTLAFRLRIEDASRTPVHTILLRTQLQIQPRRRGHTQDEKDRLLDLFGEPERWSGTLRALPWTQTTLVVPAFEGQIEVDLLAPCTYDFEVVAAKYLEALEGGDVPLLFLFNGTIFSKAGAGWSVTQVPWDREASFRMPVSVWRDLMDAYFPDHAWIRLRRESLHLLQRFKAARALLTWDDAIRELVNGTAAQTQEAAK